MNNIFNIFFLFLFYSLLIIENILSICRIFVFYASSSAAGCTLTWEWKFPETFIEIASHFFLFLDQQLISTLISIFERYFSTLNYILQDWYTGCTFLTGTENLSLHIFYSSWVSHWYLHLESKRDINLALAWTPDGWCFWDQLGIYGNHFTVQLDLNVTNSI